MGVITAGALADHPIARDFSREVHRVHRRYAVEVVSAFGLCPFVRAGEAAVEAAFGCFCVVLERDLDSGLASRLAVEARASVAHLVYPLVTTTPGAFERFAASLGEALRQTMPRAPVLAAFHPELSGDPSAPDRLVGLLRRAPDPFVQLIPEGLHEGGTTFAGIAEELPPPAAEPAKDNFDRLGGGALQRVLALLADIHADRTRSYARFLNLFEGKSTGRKGEGE